MKMTPLKTAVLGGLFAATSAQAINVDALFEGQWYRTDIDGGQGWSLDYMKVGPEKGSFFVSGYVYDDNGTPFWVVGQDVDVQAGESTLTFAEYEISFRLTPQKMHPFF